MCCKSNGGTFIIYAFPRHYRRDWPGSVSIPESNYFLRSYEFGPFRIGGCFSCGEDFELLDSMLDDGDLTQGKFRQTPNGRYTYIIEESDLGVLNETLFDRVCPFLFL